MTSGVVCVTKPEYQSIRLCCDYRHLNKYTVADSTPMKLFSECVYKVAQAKFISTGDAKSGFWQILVRPEDRWKCAIVIATCPSVRPSVTRRYCVKTKKASGMVSSPSGSPKTLVF